MMLMLYRANFSGHRRYPSLGSELVVSVHQSTHIPCAKDEFLILSFIFSTALGINCQPRSAGNFWDTFSSSFPIWVSSAIPEKCCYVESEATIASGNRRLLLRLSPIITGLAVRWGKYKKAGMWGRSAKDLREKEIFVEKLLCKNNATLLAILESSGMTSVTAGNFFGCSGWPGFFQYSSRPYALHNAFLHRLPDRWTLVDLIRPFRQCRLCMMGQYAHMLTSSSKDLTWLYCLLL